MISAARTLRSPRQSHSSEWLFCLLLLLCLTGCGNQRNTVQFAGATMGTTWHVTCVELPAGLSVESIQQGIEARLAEVNSSMSTYLPESEISRFNASPVETPFITSPDFYQVLTTALQIGRHSQGAYDVTVAPLVNLWGFGPTGAILKPPAAAAIKQLLPQVGQDQLQLRPEIREVRKLGPLSLDFSSLAKGFGVDKVAQWLAQQGVRRYLVEVGGEMKLAGASGRNDPWRIAIEQPDSTGRAMAAALTVTDTAVATSGDYRNFFELNGRRYSHSIDPRTGYPVAHDLVSVTVVHPSAMTADAWATALMVLGAERAMLVAQEQGLAVYFIRRTGSGYVHSHTPEITPYLTTARR